MRLALALELGMVNDVPALGHGSTLAWLGLSTSVGKLLKRTSTKTIACARTTSCARICLYDRRQSEYSRARKSR